MQTLVRLLSRHHKIVVKPYSPTRCLNSRQRRGGRSHAFSHRRDGLVVSAITQAQDRPTYRQMAVEHKGTWSDSVGFGHGWAGPPLASIVKYADVAVEGIVSSIRTYATPDDRDIFTEYEIATRQVIFQRIAQTTAKPGSPPPTIFKTRGGTVIFDGYPFTLYGREQTQLRVGEHLVLFGRYDAADGKWLFGDRDVFRIAHHVVLNWLPTFAEYREGLEPRMPIASFAQRVRTLVR